MVSYLVIICGFFSFFNLNLQAVEKPEEVITRLGITQNISDPIPAHIPFRDHLGNPVTIGKYFTGERPIILTPIYYTCPAVCSTTINQLIISLGKIDLKVGKDYDLLTFSFKPEEKPELAFRKRSNYIEKMRGTGLTPPPLTDDLFWPFLTSQQAEINQLLSILGFKIERDGVDYAHAPAIVVLTPQGIISRYFIGVVFDRTDLRLALIEASEGKIGNVIDAVMMFCFRYSPLTGKYSLAIKNVMRLVGGLTAFILLGLVSFLFYKERQKQKFAV